MSLYILFSGAFLMGLAGAGHCIGMCGGISAALQLGNSNVESGISQRRVLLTTYYQAGRLVTYSLLGLLISLLPWLSAQFTGHNPWPRWLAASVLLFTALYQLGINDWLKRLDRIGVGVWRGVQPLIGKLVPIDHPVKAFLAGTIWGLLPCGLVYGALLLAASSQQPIIAMLTMAVFGIATVPANLLTASMGALLNKKGIRITSSILMILFSIWIIVGPLLITHHPTMQSDITSEKQPFKHH